jgi:hypothetical protein
MSAEAQLTPMMAQYRRIKGELPKDALLLFRPGDGREFESSPLRPARPPCGEHRHGAE